MVPEGGAVTSCHRGYTECLSLTSPGSLQREQPYHRPAERQGESMSRFLGVFMPLYAIAWMLLVLACAAFLAWKHFVKDRKEDDEWR